MIDITKLTSEQYIVFLIALFIICRAIQNMVTSFSHLGNCKCEEDNDEKLDEELEIAKASYIEAYKQSIVDMSLKLTIDRDRYEDAFDSSEIKKQIERKYEDAE